MKKILGITILLAGLFAVSCKNDNLPEIVPNNEFTVECDAAQWNDGVLEFSPEAASVTIRVVHDASANAWKIRCNLDDAWAKYATLEDNLIITVKPNNGIEPRTTWVDVVIGENSYHITINQDNEFIPTYVPQPSYLPETVWKEGETVWR